MERKMKSKTSGYIIRSAAYAVFFSVAFQFVILPVLPAVAGEVVPPTPTAAATPTPTPTATATPTPTPQTPDDILTKLGRPTVVGLISLMTLLMALVFVLVIWFGRRLSMRGYLGPLAQDAIARAEIARREVILREDLVTGRMITEIEFQPNSNQFKQRYQIPLEDNPPDLIPGIKIDETGLPLEVGWGSRTGGLGGSGISGRPGAYLPGLYVPPYGGEGDELPLWPDDIRRWPADRLKSERNATVAAEGDTNAIRKDKAAKLNSIQWEINERFTHGYRQEQLDAFQKKRAKMVIDERKRAEDLLPTMDVSSFGGGWVFVLEFTTIIFIVFAVLSLGLLGVLKSEPIATILAAIAGYVLGKSTSIRGAGGEEIRRGAEEPKVLFEAMTKQEEIRSQRDEEKIKLQREVEDLQRKLAQGKVAVPGVTGLVSDEAENKIKERNLVPEKKEVENSGAEAGKVFHQSPEPNSEVSKGSTVVVFIPKKPRRAETV
jgi:hypothetical protein